MSRQIDREKNPAENCASQRRNHHDDGPWDSLRQMSQITKTASVPPTQPEVRDVMPTR